MSVTVLQAGPLSLLQALPRQGHRALGVAGGGAADAWSHQVANAILGNAADAATLEFTLVGPTLRFADAVQVAVCGATVVMEADSVALPGWRRIDLPAGATLRIGRCLDGARGYLAVRGGWQVPAVLGSRATDLRGGFGGLHGRALRAGDTLAIDAHASAIAAIHAPQASRWSINPSPDLQVDRTTVVRVLPGADATLPPDALLRGSWRVGASADRQGIRLEGPRLVLADPGERISEPVFPGTVQLPPGGQPIVLLADAQTHGGYPRIGHVIAADQPRLAQLRPGDGLRFEACTPGEAHAAACAQRARLARIRLAVSDAGP